MTRRPPPADPRLRRRWVAQHLLLGLLQLGLAVAAVLSVVLTGATTLAGVQPLTWLLVAAFLAASAARFALYLVRGGPSTKWLEPDE